jgi:hypothetical protein
MTIPTLYCGGFEEADIINEQGTFSAGANLKNGLNCHEPSHFVAWKSFVGVEQYYLQRRRVGDLDWTIIYEGINSVYLDNTPIGGVYEYRTVPVDKNGDAGIWSNPIMFKVKPTVVVTATKSCNIVTLNWTAEGAAEYIIYRDNIQIGYSNVTTWTGGGIASGTFTFKVRAFVGLYVDGGQNCYGEGEVVVALLVPQPAGTLLSSRCIGSNTVETYSDGQCGTTQQIVQSWQCDGCFNPQMGLIGVRSCSGNSVVQAGWSETCDNHFVTHVLEDCGSLGCRDGACVQPFTCSNTTQSVTGLGLPSPKNWEVYYDLGNKQVDGICVNAWRTKTGNGTNAVEIYLNNKVVCAANLGISSADILLAPPWTPWTGMTPYGSGSPDPNAASYTQWVGNLKIRVFANGTLGGSSFGEIRLEAVSWRTINV